MSVSCHAPSIVTDKYDGFDICLLLMSRYEGFFLQQDSEEWKKLHDRLITATKLEKILTGGLGKTRVRLWKEMLGMQDPIDLSENDAVKWGMEHEPVALDQFFRDHPEFQRGPQPGIIKHHHFYHCAASPDGFMYHEPTKSLMLLEIKCPYNEARVDDLPAKYLFQVQWQLFCCEPSVKAAVLYLWTPEKQVKYMIKPNQKFIEWALGFVMPFWSCVTEKIIPEPLKPEHEEQKKQWIKVLHSEAIKF